MNLVCDPATCAVESHDHTMSVHHKTGVDLDTPEAMICGDCDRPAFYDYADDRYHHNVEPERGCFLISAE